MLAKIQRWPPYHGATQRPEPPEQNDGEQQQQDEQRHGHKRPVGLEPEVKVQPSGRRWNVGVVLVPGVRDTHTGDGSYRD